MNGVVVGRIGLRILQGTGDDGGHVFLKWGVFFLYENEEDQNNITFLHVFFVDFFRESRRFCMRHILMCVKHSTFHVAM